MEQKVGLSRKQSDFLTAPMHRTNILDGSVRSGKTFISLPKFALEVKQSPDYYEFLMVGKTINSLNRNCLHLMQKIVGKSNFQYSLTKKEGVLFGHVVYLEGANDEQAFTKIQGMTLGGAYCDEIVNYPESFVRMLQSRLSLPKAFLLATCNPDNPGHYIKTEFIDNPNIDIKVWHFLLDDNIFLDPGYVENIKKEYSGVFYKRYILGLWVAAEGVIFEQFANNPEKYIVDEYDPDKIARISFGIDWGGNKSKTTFVLTGITFDKKLVILADKKIGGEKGTIDPDYIYREFIMFARELLPIYKKSMVMGVFCDSAEQLLINGLYRAINATELNIRVGDCDKKTIVARILFKNAMLNTGRYIVQRRCQNVINSTMTQVWDDHYQGDVRLDDGSVDIDTADAEEYTWARFIPELQE